MRKLWPHYKEVIENLIAAIITNLARFKEESFAIDKDGGGGEPNSDH